MRLSGSTALFYVATALLVAGAVTSAASTAPASPAAGTVVTPADWPFAIYRITADDLSQHSVRVAGPHVYWCENRQVPQGDGSVIGTPPVVRYLNRDTGARAYIDPRPAGIWDVSAGGDWVVYQRDDATSTVAAWNPNTGKHRTIATGVRLAGNTATDGTHIAWREYTHGDDAPGIEYKLVIDTIAPGPSTDIADDAFCAPAIDRGVVAWATWTPSSNGTTTLRAYDIRTGTRSSVRIAGFSATQRVDISGPLVVAAGEDSGYTSHIYVWDTRTGQVRKVYSVPIGTASVGSAYVSGNRVVFEETPRKAFSQARTLDLATGAIADVTPADLWGSLWSLDGSVIGMIIKRPAWTVEAAWCDLDARRPPTPAADNSGSTPDVTAPAPTITPATSASASPARRPGRLLIAEAETGDATAETTTAAEATRTAEVEPVSDRDDTAGPPDSDAPPTSGSASDESGGIGNLGSTYWPLAATAVLAVLGGAAYAVRRGRQRTGAP